MPHLFKEKANDPTGRAATFACGTADQALGKARELAGRGFRDISVVDPKGKEFNTSALDKSLDRD